MRCRDGCHARRARSAGDIDRHPGTKYRDPCRRVATPDDPAIEVVFLDQSLTPLDRASMRRNGVPTWTESRRSARSARNKEIAGRLFRPSRDHRRRRSSARATAARVAAEADAEVAVHLEVIPGHDEHALFVAQPLDERRRVDWVARSERTRWRRPPGGSGHERRRAAFDPAADDRVVAAMMPRVRARMRSRARARAPCARADRSARRGQWSCSRESPTARRRATAARPPSRCAVPAARRPLTGRS